MKTVYIALFVLLLGTSALTANAAMLTVQNEVGSVGARVAIPITFTTGEEPVNVVEGSIRIPDGLLVERIDTSRAAFPLFASGPRYELSSKSISFTAGAPQGIPPYTSGLLFTLYARAESEAAYEITPLEVEAYQSDGNGTRVAVAGAPGTVSVGPRGSTQEERFATGGREALIAEIGKDATLFNGLWFATFFGGSTGSTVAYYEVREGWWRLSTERADRYYVLKDQERRTSLWITAVGEDGSRTTILVPALHPWAERAVLLALSLCGLLIAYLLYRRVRTKKTI